MTPDDFNPLLLPNLYPGASQDHRLTYVFQFLVRSSIRECPTEEDHRYPYILGRSLAEEDKVIDSLVSDAWSFFLEAFFLLSRLRSTSLNPDASGYRDNFALFTSDRSIRITE